MSTVRYGQGVAADYEPRTGRIPIRLDSPRQPDDLFPAKAYVGEVVPFRATVFAEGHAALGADLLLTDPDGAQSRHRMRMVAPGTDRWVAPVLLEHEGIWQYSVQAWFDDWATWLHDTEIKVPAGIDAALMLAEGVVLLRRAHERAAGNPVIADTLKTMSDASLSPALRLAAATDPKLAAALQEHPIASGITLSLPLPVRVERTRAGVGSWYEFFPRSEGAKQLKGGAWRSGTFRTAARRLPALARLGFDVIYLPPIHPIGTAFRKGPNNTPDAGPNDPGSPWAIGSPDGGHTAINPELGTLQDFRDFLTVAGNHNQEVALDLALQCSPDHPWVKEHPEWFTARVDGSIAYAENPPKKYQDIYPLNFDNDPEGLREEILRVVRYWMGVGVRIFRVDNPHTKPLWFWEWLLHEVAQTDPDVVFLAEAFTQPAMMHALAQVGFQQSYTYFTWRNTKPELEDYLTELSTQSSDFLRPNLFVNTPDILTEYLQFGGVPAYKVRAAIAATASPTWGVYSGFELIENVARPGSEENIDNEKYEYRPRDWSAAQKEGRSIAPYLGLLNRIRSEHPSLRQLRNLEVHWSDDDSVLVYSKYLSGQFTRSGRSDAIIVVANLDPHAMRETTVHLDVTRFGMELDQRFTVTDLVSKDRFEWSADNYVRLDPFKEPVHILRVDYAKGH